MPARFAKAKIRGRHGSLLPKCPAVKPGGQQSCARHLATLSRRLSTFMYSLRTDGRSGPDLRTSWLPRDVTGDRLPMRVLGANAGHGFVHFATVAEGRL